MDDPYIFGDHGVTTLLDQARRGRVLRFERTVGSDEVALIRVRYRNLRKGTIRYDLIDHTGRSHETPYEKYLDSLTYLRWCRVATADWHAARCLEVLSAD